MAEREDDLTLATLRQLDGDLSPAERAAFNERLRGDAGARRALIDHCIHTVLLAEATGGAGRGQNAVADDAGFRRRRIGRVALAAAAVLALAASAVVVIVGALSGPASAPDSAPESVGVIVDISDAEWLTEPMTIGGDLTTGRVAIDAGTIDLQLHGGTTMRIVGPAEFTARSTGVVRLHHGRLAASVPHSAVGFTVESRGFDIVDLGTAFQLRIDRSGAGQVYVSEGSVEVRPRGGGAGATVLIAGQTSSIDEAGRLSAVGAGPDLGVIAPQPIYRETFANPHPTDRPIEEAGWHIHKAGGVPGELSTLSFVGSGSGEPIASRPPAVDSTDAFMLTMDDQEGVDYLFWTDELRIPRDQWRIRRVSWKQHHNSWDQRIRLALRIGDAWYVSEPAAIDATPGAGWRAASIETPETSWRRVHFEVGQTLALGDPADLPAGDVTAFGLYAERRVGWKLRFDTIQIDAVPAEWAADPD